MSGEHPMDRSAGRTPASTTVEGRILERLVDQTTDAIREQGEAFRETTNHAIKAMTDITATQQVLISAITEQRNESTAQHAALLQEVKAGHDRIESAIRSKDDEGKGTLTRLLDWFGTHPAGGMLVMFVLLATIFTIALVLITAPAENLRSIQDRGAEQTAPTKGE